MHILKVISAISANASFWGKCNILMNVFCCLFRIEDASEIGAIEANARVSQIRKGRHSLTKFSAHRFYHFENIKEN
jgi:hypothetical protein